MNTLLLWEHPEPSEADTRISDRQPQLFATFSTGGSDPRGFCHCDRQAQFVTGETVVVDGGTLLT
jgi:hypothetical protein